MIEIPTLVLDEKKCRRNIERMVTKARKNNLTFRPHFKTHQSLEIGAWFKAMGVNQITVSSLQMAAYFSSQWNDITVAFPVNVCEIDRINRLANKITLNLLVESIETLVFLKEHLQAKVGVFLKIDVGYHRTGIAPENTRLISTLLERITNTPALVFKGLLGHAGHTYTCNNRSEIMSIHDTSKETMIALKEHYLKDFPETIISLGDTPSCSVAENFDGIDEIRPGNFVFYDLTQAQIGSNGLDEIAVAMACPIVAVHPHKLIVYGGGVHFAKDQLIDDQHGAIYGKVVQHRGLHWGKTIPDMYVSKLSQEHGTVHLPPTEKGKYAVGDHLFILPVHSCMTADAMKAYLNSNQQIIHRL